MLKSAHRGYEYQDLLCAIRLVDLVLGLARSVQIDTKLVDDDRFDDLTTHWVAGARERCQIKHREKTDVPLPLDTFTSDRRDCRLDRLVAAAIADRSVAGPDMPHSFRLVACDAPPVNAKLARALRGASPDPGAFVAGFGTQRFVFDPAVLWPPLPSAKRRRPAKDPWGFLRDGRMSRADLVWFCERFIIETSAPAASLDLLAPGPAEHALLARVSDEIGAGVYPNSHRSPADVAMAFITAARRARQGQPVTANDVLRQAGLRSDFGAVARVFPVDPKTEVRLKSTVSSIAASAEEVADRGGTLLVVGPPGQGKTWTCQRLRDALEADGWLVAEHYCYVGDADDKHPRVTAETIFGSLLARLVDQRPSLSEEKRPRLAADAKSLVQTIARALAGTPRPRIALIVDGLDHVTRVLGSTTGRPDPSTSLAEDLSLLSLPPGCLLIVLSQPGPHLSPLEKQGAVWKDLPSWGSAQIGRLAMALGVIASRSVRRDRRKVQAVVTALHERSGGNPLYATYLCRELKRSAVAAADPLGAIAALPPFDGTLEGYYAHLVSAAGPGKLVAEIIALPSFGVTRTELKEIFPESAHAVDAALDLFAPVLVERSTQGGIRVWHESFARYLLRSLEAEPTAHAARLEQLIKWLHSLGFLVDGRAYRWLLPLLAAAGRDQEVTDAVTVDFVAASVAAGFSANAIMRNLVVAASSAARILAWDKLVQYTELARAAVTFEFENLSVVVEFADVYGSLLGPARFADRLLDDGRTTLPSRQGLELCAELDDAGAVAPWREYLAAFERERETDNVQYGEESDRAVLLARFRGSLRLAPRINPKRVAEWLEDVELPAAGIVRVVMSTMGAAQAVDLLDHLPTTLRSRYALDLAERLAKRGGEAAEAECSLPAEKLVRTLREHGFPEGAVPRLQALGLDVSQFADRYRREILQSLTVSVIDDQIEFAPKTVLEWLDCIELAAHVDAQGLAPAEELLAGPGWYRCWLRFALAFARSWSQTRAKDESPVLGALRRLEEDLRPFEGRPRACDLYSLHGTIAATIRRALSQVPDDEWSAALRVLERVSDETSTTMSGELGGPVPRDELLRLVCELATPSRVAASEEVVERLLAGVRRSHFYADVARCELLAARLAIASGDRQGAERRQRQAAELLTAYGFHKDITIYELLDSMPALIDSDVRLARVRLALLQPLCERVVEHTDKRETRHAPSRWWKLLVKADPEAAGTLLLKGMLSFPNYPRPRLEQACDELWRVNTEIADPVIAGALRVAVETTSDARDAVVIERLRAIGEKAEGDVDAQCARLARWIVARYDEDAVTATGGSPEAVAALEAVNRAGAALGVSAASRGVPNAEPTNAAVGARGSGVNENLADVFLMDYSAGADGLARGIREWQQRPYRSSAPRWDADRFVNAVGYRLAELCAGGAVDEAERILRLVADDSRLEDVGNIEALAAGLDRLGATRLAVVAHVLAFSREGSGGWRPFGREEHIPALRRALELDRETALRVLAQEMVRAVRAPGSGVTEGLVGAFASLRLVLPSLAPTGCECAPASSQPHACAFSLWDAAHQVIAARLPGTAEEDDAELPYSPGAEESVGSSICSSSADKACVAATVALLASPVREVKRRTLLALSMLVRARPGVVAAPLGAALASLDVPTLTWLLWVLAAADPRVVTELAEPLLRLALDPHLCVRTLARQLAVEAGLSPGALPAQGADELLLRAADQKPERLTLADANEESPSYAESELVEDMAGERIRRAEGLLPDLKLAVVARVAAQRSSDRWRRKLDQQLRHLTIPGDRHLPDALLAPEEAVEVALQEAAGGARAALAAGGRLAPDPEAAEALLCDMLLDDPQLALTMEAARMPRPAFPLPPGKGSPAWTGATALEDPSGEELLLLTSNESAEAAPEAAFDGSKWRLIAVRESCILGADVYTNAPEGHVSRNAAIELRPSGDLVALDRPPFGEGHIRSWFLDVVVASPPGRDQALPLVGLDQGSQYRGSFGRSGLGKAGRLLVPQPGLLAMLDLHGRNTRVELALGDHQGAGLLYRTWRCRYGTSEYRLSEPSLRGSALFLRSDLFERLRATLGPKLVWREYEVGRDVKAKPGGGPQSPLVSSDRNDFDLPSR